MSRNEPLRVQIERNVFEGICAAARRARSQEQMGLLGHDPRRPAAINGAWLLPARTSGSHAEADPLSIRSAADTIRGCGQQLVGIWHSHGNHAPFHSAIDDDLVARIMPALAESRYERPRTGPTVPVATSQDSAMLPLDDGRWLQLELRGAAVPGMPDIFERIGWEGIEASFGGDAAPKVMLDGKWLRLRAGGVELRLGLPEGAAVTSSVSDPVAYRVARLFSLVVNRRGERYAEAITVHDYGGQSHVTQRVCEIEILDDAEPGAASAPRPLGLAGSLRVIEPLSLACALGRHWWSAMP